MRSLFLLALVGLLAGCDLIRIGDYDDYGEFEATATGAFSLDMHGTALLWPEDGGSYRHFSLNITSPDFAGFITFDLADDRPRSGTVALGPGGVPVTYEVDNRTDQEFVADAGTLTFEDVGDEEALGRFEFDATDGEGQRVRVAGTFRARFRITAALAV